MRPAVGRRPDGDQRREQRPQQQAQMPPPPVTRTITFVEGMTVKDLADKLDQRVKDVLKKLLDKRLMMTINSTVDTDTASMIAREFGAELQLRTFEQDMLEVEAEDVKPEDTITRAPVVTVMGHVDHGKTTLLDAIRTTRVAEREAGGITQHIGAYHVTTDGGRNIVFLDTPGHEAFTLMRARGAKVTDVVVLVVAADDGVMPQTREAIDHAKAANVPIIVAINKIDKQGSDAERVKRELSDLNLVPEDWGGQTVMVPVSAKKKTGLDTLLEMILLVSDIGEYKANPKRNASGTVLESKLDRGRGPVATILVQDGTLRVGDTFIAGPIVGRVRALIDDRGKPIKVAPPSTPVEVLGLTGLPQPGDAFQAMTDAAKARQIATYRQGMAKEKALGAKGSRLTLESLQQQIAEGGMKDLPIVIKSDVQGSAEVLADTLSKLSDERVRIKIIHSGVGAINESDVLLASASNAIIIGFNVRPDRNAEALAEREEVDVRHHTVIYNVTDEMKKAMTGLLEPTLKEVRLGAAEVRNIFKVPKAGTIAGCYVIEGRITRSGDTKARLHARRRDGARRQDRIAAPLQGRRERSEDRLRVRHRLRQVQRRQGRRPDRGVHDRAGRTFRPNAQLAVPSAIVTADVTSAQPTLRQAADRCRDHHRLTRIESERGRAVELYGPGLQTGARRGSDSRGSHHDDCARAARSRRGIRHRHARAGERRPAARARLLHEPRRCDGAQEHRARPRARRRIHAAADRPAPSPAPRARKCSSSSTRASATRIASSSC